SSHRAGSRLDGHPTSSRRSRSGSGLGVRVAHTFPGSSADDRGSGWWKSGPGSGYVGMSKRLPGPMRQSRKSDERTISAADSVTRRAGRVRALAETARPAQPIAPIGSGPAQAGAHTLDTAEHH